MHTTKTTGLMQLTEVIRKHIDWTVKVQQTPMTKEKADSVYLILSTLKKMADQYDINLPMGNATESVELNAIMKIIPELYYKFIVKNHPKT